MIYLPKLIFLVTKTSNHFSTDDVGFKIGESSKEHLVLQVHYKHPLQEADNTGLDLHFTDKK
jgi:hypothetical protein